LSHSYPFRRAFAVLPAPALLLLALLYAAPAQAETVSVKLKGGDRVSGELVSEDDRETVIDHPVFGRLVVPKTKMALRDGEQPGLFHTSLLAGWHKEIGIGITGQEGNSPEANFLLTGGLDRTTETWRYQLEGEYKIATESSERTSNYADIRSRRDWLFPGSRWFAAVGNIYQYDEFEPWQHRVQILAGPGYHLFQGEVLTLDILAAPSYLYEFGDVNESRPEMMLGLEATWRPIDGHRFRIRNYFLQGLRESEWRMRTSVEWKMQILGSEHLGLVLGARNEYDTAADDERNNLKYWSRLSYDF
jgi:small nuclear ribonucleoprotein (snRNP)-like protein